MWGTIPKSRLQSPYLENSPVNHPMAGSDVYKLLWGVILSSQMSAAECKEILYKLSKIKRLEKGYITYLNKKRYKILITNFMSKTIFRFLFDHYSSELSLEELSCPLCQLTFSNNMSMRMHFNNYQHIERYKYAKNELTFFYKGPEIDMQHL